MYFTLVIGQSKSRDRSPGIFIFPKKISVARYTHFPGPPRGPRAEWGVGSQGHKHGRLYYYYTLLYSEYTRYLQISQFTLLYFENFQIDLFKFAFFSINKIYELEYFQPVFFKSIVSLFILDFSPNIMIVLHNLLIFHI